MTLVVIPNRREPVYCFIEGDPLARVDFAVLLDKFVQVLVAFELDLREIRRDGEPGTLETTQISSHAPVVPSLGGRVGGIVIRLCQINRAEALDVIPGAGHQVRLDQIQARTDIAKEIDLHYLETGLRDRAIPKYLFLEQFVDRGPLILQVRIGLLAVNVEDDLTHAVACN